MEPLFQPPPPNLEYLDLYVKNDSLSILRVPQTQDFIQKEIGVPRLT
jgi:hypothetical protein